MQFKFLPLFTSNIDHCQQHSSTSIYLDFDKVVWFHEPGRGHEESGVSDSPRRRDDLPASSMNRFSGDDGIENLKFAVSDRFVAKRTFPSSPLKALDDRVFDGGKEILVDLGGKRVVD